MSIQLYEHQTNVLRDTAGHSRVAYYLDMGLGKTFVGSVKLDDLGAIDNLIVCQKSKVADWVDHMRDHHPMFITFDLTNKKSFDAFVAMAITSEDDRQGRPVVGVINYELAWRRPVLAKLRAFTLMLDESALIQNRKAKQTRFILKLSPANVILLSGTPTAGKYERLWTQAKLLGWPISESTYNETFINWVNLPIMTRGGMIQQKVVNRRNPYKNVDRLKRKFREHGAVFMKTDDVMTLPDQTFIVKAVDASPIYKRFMRDKWVTVDGRDLMGDTPLTQRMFARQLCGQYSDAKLTAMDDIIASTDDRLIVFYNFTAERDAIRAICERHGKPTSVIAGDIKDLTAYKNDADSVTLVQYQAGAMGVNLQLANKVVYFSLPERSDLFEQSKKRIHRIGQARPCFYYLLIVANSVESHIHSALSQYRDYTDELFKEIT